jgi:hypothetical protein
MATFKELSSADIKNSRSFLNQLVDVIQEDISGSNTRQKHQVFITGGIGPGVTSSLFHTVHDQDFTLQTANPVMDVTYGVFSGSTAVANSTVGSDTAGKLLFMSTSLMMREKMSIYKQYAQLLLGDSTSQFSAPFSNANADGSDNIDHALFLNFKRLFHRDKVKRETFAMKFYQTASKVMNEHEDPQELNIHKTSNLGATVYTDVGSSQAKETSFGGEVGNLVDASNTDRTVGLIFYDRGIVMLDMEKSTSGSQHVSGTISAMRNGTTVDSAGRSIAPGQIMFGDGTHGRGRNFIPDFVVSASMDNILDHVCSTRFSSGSNTAATFQNITNINSTLVFCRSTADEFNYSSNPTFVDTDGRITVIDDGLEDLQRTFTFVTTVGLYDANNNLLAVSKLSRPVEKNDEKDLTFRIRLDF